MIDDAMGIVVCIKQVQALFFVPFYNNFAATLLCQEFYPLN